MLKSNWLFAILRISLLVFLVAFSVKFVSAQNLASKDFYLVEDLDLEKVDLSERKKLDSILTLYHKAKGFPDTSRFYFLEQLIVGFESGNIEKLYRTHYLSETESITQGIKVDKTIKKRLFYARGNALLNYGIMYLYGGSQDTALYYFEQGLPFLKETDSISLTALACNVTSICYKNLGKLNEAVDKAMMALKLVEKSGDKSSLPVVYNNLAGLHQSLGNYELSLGFFDKVLKEIDSVENSANFGIVLVNRADLMMDHLSDTLGAIQYLERSRSILDTTYSSFIAIRHGMAVLYSLGRVRLWQGKISEAEKLFEDGLKLAQTNKQQVAESRLYTAIASTYFARKNYSSTINYASKGLEIAIANQMIPEQISAHQFLFQAYQALGQFKKSNDHLQKYFSLKEKQKNEEDKKALVQRNLQYEYDKKRKIDSLENTQKIELSEAKQQTANEKAARSRFQMVVSVIIAVLLLLFLWFAISRLRKINEQKAALDRAYERLEEAKKTEVAAMNLKAIRAQMNPHFIFNSLNSIQNLIIQQDADKSYDYVSEFATLVRMTLNHSEKELVPFYQEKEFLETYLGLEKLRFSTSFNYEIHSNIENENVEIPSLVIQPFIENALLHGLLHKRGDKSLKLTFDLDKQFVCTIEDNGIGRKRAQEIKERQGGSHQSFSTQAIKKRLKMLSENMEQEASFSYEDILVNGVVSGTRLKLILPFEVAL